MDTKNNYAVPLAIVLAGVIIAGAIYFGDSTPVKPTVPKVVNKSLEQIRPITDSDHIRGNPNAELFIVEYTDTECPFCVRFHQTMKQVMNIYGKEGKVAWVYRHFPLESLHPKAFQESVALECANEVGGNDKFWAYVDRLYETTPANNGLDPAELPKIAAYVGLDVSKFNTCLSSGRYDEKIRADIENAQATGGAGTPWSIIISKDGTKTAINGAQPYAAVKQTIDALLK